jgi:hypothetical protein
LSTTTLDASTGPLFSAGIVRGLLVTVTPGGWAVRRRGGLLASGREIGSAGIAKALAALDGVKDGAR